MPSNRPLLIAAIAAGVAAIAAAVTVGVSIATPRGQAAGPALPAFVAASTAKPGAVTVQGAGSATAAPDEASVVLGVAALRANVGDANNAAGNDMKALIDALHGQGVEDKDIQTWSLSVTQNTTCCPQTVQGYFSSSQVSVRIHHLSNVGAVIAAAASAVGNDFRVQEVRLSISDPTAAVKTARAAAMKDAGERAKQWADLAGLRLGHISGVSEVVNQPAGIQCAGGCGGAGGPGVQPGVSTVSVWVTVVYDIA